MDMENRRPPHLSKCIRLICGMCFQKLEKPNQQVASWCVHILPCATAPVSTTFSVYSATDSTIGDLSKVGGMPSKVKALIMDIKKLCDTKR